MLSWMVHYKNKYPGGRVSASESAIDVYDVEGNHVVALRRSADGGFHCKSAEMGCVDSHDLAPIPKESRCFKVRDGKISKDEEHDSRVEKRKEFLLGNKIGSCHELKASKMLFDDKQRLIK